MLNSDLATLKIFSTFPLKHEQNTKIPPDLYKTTKIKLTEKAIDGHNKMCYNYIQALFIVHYKTKEGNGSNDQHYKEGQHQRGL